MTVNLDRRAGGDREPPDAAPAPRVQRRVAVGAAGSPAEHEADQVAAAVVSGAPQGHLVVDDGPVAPGQMLKSSFTAPLREAVTAAADAELGPAFSAVGCPYIDAYFVRYSGAPPRISRRCCAASPPGRRARAPRPS